MIPVYIWSVGLSNCLSLTDTIDLNLTQILILVTSLQFKISFHFYGSDF